MRRKRMKKAIAVSTTLALLTGLAGCGTASVEESPAQTFESGEETAEEPAAVEPVSAGKTLKIAVSSSSISEKEGTAPMEAMFEKFEEENDCDVEIVVVAHDGWADYMTKLQTMIISGNGPDLFQNPHEGGRMANSLGLSQPLNDYMDAHPEAWEEYTANTINVLQKAREVDGKIYGLPCFYQTTYMWLNMDRLEAAGLDVPDVDWTWDEFEHYLEVLSQPDADGNKQYAWAIPDYYFVYNQWLYSFGTGYMDDEYKEVTFDSEASIELMEVCYEAVRNGIAPMPDKNYDYQQQLVDGHVAMTTAGRWMVNYCNNNDLDNVAVVRVPQKYSSRQEYAIGNFEVCSSTDNYDLAAACCFYTAGKDWVEKYSNDTANIPACKGVNLTDPLTDKGYTNMELFSDLPDNSYPMQNPSSFTELSNIFDRTFTSVMAGEVTPEEGCKNAAEEMRAAVAANPD